MKNIEAIILSVLKDIGEEYKNEELCTPDTKTILFGKNLDSMGIVLLVTDLEDEIYSELGVNISLAEERAMSQKTSPFRSVVTLVRYVETLIEEQVSLR